MNEEKESAVEPRQARRTGKDFGMVGDPTGAPCRSIPSPGVYAESTPRRDPWRGSIGGETHPGLIPWRGPHELAASGAEVQIADRHQPKPHERRQAKKYS